MTQDGLNKIENLTHETRTKIEKAHKIILTLLKIKKRKELLRYLISRREVVQKERAIRDFKSMSRKIIVVKHFIRRFANYAMARII
jgi:hypothetical protein